MSEATSSNSFTSRPEIRKPDVQQVQINNGVSELQQDPDGSFFVNGIFAYEYDDAVLAQKIDTIPSGLFTLRDPAEIEILISVFDALEMLPSLDDINNLEETGQHEIAAKYTVLREGFTEFLRLAINSYREIYMPNNIRDTEKISEIYEQTTQFDSTDVLRALSILRKKHNKSVTIYNAEAIIRSLYRE